jgi:hypothetical protein
MKLFFALRGFEVIMKKIRPEEVVNIDIIKSASALYVCSALWHADFIHKPRAISIPNYLAML